MDDSADFFVDKEEQITKRVRKKHRFNAESVLLVEIMEANISNLFAVQDR